MSNTYTTIQGDMWDTIAYKVYGNETYMTYLLEANQCYKDVAIFPAGVALATPDAPSVSTSNLPPWRG